MSNYCSLALKEWSIAVDALAKGNQIIVLRKGGIHREDRNFRMIHDEFLLYPTFEHQKSEILKRPYNDQIKNLPYIHDNHRSIVFSHWAKLTAKYELTDQNTLNKLSPYHIWTQDYAEKRLHWRPSYPLTIALLRIHTLDQPQVVPVKKEYIGCKSWVKIDQRIDLGKLNPVLTNNEYSTISKDISKIFEDNPEYHLG